VAAWAGFSGGASVEGGHVPDILKAIMDFTAFGVAAAVLSLVV
jgi:hypothetical protein